MKVVNEYNNYVDFLHKKKEEGEILEFVILNSTVKRNNIYVESNFQIESILKSSREEVVIQIYVPKGEMLGIASFTLSEGDTFEEFEKEYHDAVFIASQSLSKKFNLPKEGENILDDSHINYENFYSKKFIEAFTNNSLSTYISEKLEELKEAITKKSDEIVSLHFNSFEYHTTVSEKFLKTSYGVEKGYMKDSAYMEFILTAKDIKTGKESEHIVYKKLNDVFDFDYTSFFLNQSQYARDTILAKKPNEFQGPVILGEISTPDFFLPEPPNNSAIMFSSAALKYQKISNYELENEIVKAQKDTLTVNLDATLKGNNASAPFDLNGISGQNICIIENNIFKKFYGDLRNSQYLDIQPTGPMGSIVVEEGKKTITELKNEDEYLEIVNFGWFNPDVSSGNFSAEVRLGYIVKDGVKTPFKGGLFTGNIFNLLEDCELSKEIIEETGYKGPKAIKFYKGELVGLD